jgi:EamA-like transporter family
VPSRRFQCWCASWRATRIHFRPSPSASPSARRCWLRSALGRGGEPGLDPGHGSMLLVIVVLVYLGAGPTALSYLCYTYGMRLSRSVTSGVAATMIEPAVAVLLAAVLLGEQLAPTAWLGAACLPAASVLLGLDGRRSKPASPGNPLPVPPTRAEGKGSVVSIDCLVTTGRESAI